MNYFKELNFGDSKLNLQLCRKGFIWMLIILGVILSGCEGESTPVQNNDEYYVKYIVKSRSLYSVSITARIKSENNSNIVFTISKGDWEVTVGPVQKYFPASLDASYNTSQTLAQTYIDVEIHVSKNNGPFALKSNNSSTDVRMSASTSYILD
jgi:hypothetical protein